MYAPPQQMQQQPPQEEDQEASHTDCVPLFYYINSDLRDHFYSTNFKELEGGKLHYSFLGVMAGSVRTCARVCVRILRVGTSGRTPGMNDRMELKTLRCRRVCHLQIGHGARVPVLQQF